MNRKSRPGVGRLFAMWLVEGFEVVYAEDAVQGVDGGLVATCRAHDLAVAGGQAVTQGVDVSHLVVGAGGQGHADALQGQ